MNIIWIKEQEILDVKPTKNDVLIVDPFSGPAFTHLAKYPCSVLGPR